MTNAHETRWLVDIVIDELATARALANLSHQLIETTFSDLVSATRQRVHIEG